MYFKNKFIITNIFLKESIFLLLGIESRDLNLFIIATRNTYNLTFLHLMDGRKYEKTHKMDDFFSVKQIVVIAPSITKYPPAKKICQRSKAITRPPLRTSITVLVSQGQLELSWWWWFGSPSVLFVARSSQTSSNHYRPLSPNKRCL